MGITDNNNTDEFDNQKSVLWSYDNLHGAKVDSEKRLWVNNKNTVTPGSFSNALNKKYRMKDMNVSANGIARGTSVTVANGYVRVFGYTGNGYLLGFLLNLETSTGWTVKLEIDSEVIYEILYDDMVSSAIYSADLNSDDDLGITISTGDIFQYHPPLSLPIYYETKIELFVKRTGSTKKFDAGLMFYTEGL
jgi:hypothetical protein